MTIILLCETFSSPLHYEFNYKVKKWFISQSSGTKNLPTPNSQPLCNKGITYEIGSSATIISQQVCNQKFGCDDPVFYQQLERFDLISPFF